MFVIDNYDVVVIGAGHAGCEAALASARMGKKTLMATLNLDNIALMVNRRFEHHVQEMLWLHRQYLQDEV